MGLEITTAAEGRDLVLTCRLAAPPEKVWAAWTEPDLLVRWFTPAPWATASAELDVRPGGTSLVVMRSPEGQEFPNRGVYLEVEPGRKLVFTDAFVAAWEPAEKPFMTGILTLESDGAGGTLYSARVKHGSLADREAHEKMGFHEGWPAATRQLAALVEGC